MLNVEYKTGGQVRQYDTHVYVLQCWKAFQAKKARIKDSSANRFKPMTFSTNALPANLTSRYLEH